MPGLITAIGGFLAAQGLVTSLLYTNASFVTARNRELYGNKPTMLPDLSSLVLARWKGNINDSQYTKHAREIGFAGDIAEPIFESSRRLLDTQDYIAAWRRGFIDERALDEYLHENQLTDRERKLAKQVSEFFPAPQDLIRFAVREVYSDEIRQRFGMDEDRPPRFMEEAARAGVPAEQAGNYWAAHWDLPSVNQAFEMFQRDVIPREDLEKLLRALDIMPFWREKLTQIAYRTITRVDARRMHEMGFLDNAALTELYRHIGYSPEDAERMTQWTIAYNTGGEQQVTRSAILKAFKDGLISESEATDMLDGLGLPEETVDFYIAQAAFEKSQDRIEQETRDQLARSRAGAQSLEDSANQLRSTGVPETYVQEQLERERLQSADKLKMPTKADLTDWIEKGIITEETFVERMQLLGYRHEDVVRYLEELLIDIEERERKYLGNSTYLRWYKKGILSENELVAQLSEKGVSAEDINNLLLEIQE
jgi:Ca2+-binding EF-hand superfamily protein